jgi:hypothetical protein
MPLLSVAEVIPDPDFCQNFIIHRLNGDWNDAGLFIGVDTPIYTTGVIVPQKTRDMIQTPQGDQIQGSIDVYTNTPIFTTATREDDSKISDEVEWRNERYKILSVENFADFGYYHAVAVYKRGD